MRITTNEQLAEIAELIGPQNLRESTRLLADGGKMWFFRTSEEVQACPDLNNAERQNAMANIGNLGWATITRTVPQEFPHPSDRVFVGFRDSHSFGHGPGNWSH